MYSINSSQLQAFAPSLDISQISDLVDAFNQTMAKFGIDQQPRRVRYFLAQSSYESSGFTKWEEDLYYVHADRLVAEWPTRFTLNQSNTRYAYAPDYVDNPQKLAALVYANRYGNGDVNSNDGWNYRGRGAFGLTFKDNYMHYSMDMYGDTRIVDNPDMVSSAPDSILSAGWFWNANSLNNEADADQFTRTTDIINGSTATVSQRLQVLNRANQIFIW